MLAVGKADPRFPGVTKGGTAEKSLRPYFRDDGFIVVRSGYRLVNAGRVSMGGSDRDSRAGGVR